MKQLSCFTCMFIFSLLILDLISQVFALDLIENCSNSASLLKIMLKTRNTHRTYICDTDQWKILKWFYVITISFILLCMTGVLCITCLICMLLVFTVENLFNQADISNLQFSHSSVKHIKSTNQKNNLVLSVVTAAPLLFPF